MVHYPIFNKDMMLNRSGSVIFGGIDTKKYIGSLEKRAIIPASSVPGGADRSVTM